MKIPSERESDHMHPIDRTRKQLMYATRGLAVLAQFVVLMTLVETVVLVLVILAKVEVSPFPSYPTSTMAMLVVAQAGFFVMGSLCVILFERRRKDGDAAFQELSNLLQGETFDQEGVLEIRVELRRFASASDLPLVPGKAGPGVYALIDLVLLVASMWILLS